jgi:hypothetical protein
VDTAVQVPYATQFASLQDVANFLNGLERYYLSRGWSFNAVVQDQFVSNWARSCYEFLAWFYDNTSNPGAFIILSPSSSQVEFTTEQGEPQSVEQFVNGTYSLVGKSGQPVNPKTVDIARDGGHLLVTPAN